MEKFKEPPEQAIEKENNVQRLPVDNVVYVSKILVKEHEIEVVPALRL